MKYKRLLLDPCNSSLTLSPYGGDAGAQVYRNHVVFNNALDAELYFWHPVLGTFRSNTAPGTSGVLVPYGSIAQASNAASTRAIAGCFEIMYIGAENSRAGAVYCGVVPGAIVWNYLAAAQGGAGSTLDMANVASYFTNASRTPVDKCSVNWFPGQGDEDWYPPITLNAAQTGAIEKIFASTHFTAVFVAGAGVNTMRSSVTGVIEVQSLQASPAGAVAQVPWSVSSSSGGALPWKDVLRQLSNQDSSWYLDTFRKVAKFGVGLVGSAVSGGLPGALGYLTKSATSLAFGGPKMQITRSGR